MKEIIFRRTNGTDPDFLKLVTLLDASLAKTDGDLHDFYNQFNGLEAIKHVVVAFAEDTPVACGAIKTYNVKVAEVKRMYTLPAYRGKGVGSKILKNLESWAKELGFDSCVLETGKRQPDAIALYVKNGYQKIPRYGQYAGMDNSVCFQKML